MVRVLGTEVIMVRTDRVQAHPRNPNVGNLDVLVESMRTNGFYGALIVQRATKHILAGNHRWQAAKRLGMTKVPVIYVDVDDAQAVRILLADNRTSELAHRDPAALLALLDEVHASADGLVGVGFGVDDLDDLRSLTTTPSIADVQAQVGEYDLTDAWPTITLRVSPEIKQTFDVRWAALAGTDSEKLLLLMDA